MCEEVVKLDKHDIVLICHLIGWRQLYSWYCDKFGSPWEKKMIIEQYRESLEVFTSK